MSMDEHTTKPAGSNGGVAARTDVCPSKRKQLDLATVKEQLEDTTGPEYWRSLEELAGSDEFQEMMHREFPKGASEWLDDFSRRGFLKTMGASLALAGLTGCTRMPNTEIVPYVRQPENVIPGRPMFYATAFTLAGYAAPILVESNMFRPTKVEGNPQHPASLGGTDIYSQASILDLYDPDRAQNITYMGDVRSWTAFTEALRGPLSAEKSMAGGGIRILTQTVSSPTLAAQIHEYLEANPQAKWHVFEPISRDNVVEGAKLAFGEPVETRYDFSKADVIVSLDADFLYAGFPGSARYTRDFATRRNPDANMSRLYVIESTPSSTGMKADHRLPVRAVDVEKSARALASAAGVGGGADASGEQQNLISAIAKDLQAHKGSSIVIAGDHQPPAVHALAHSTNQVLGNVGKTVFYTEPVDANPINRNESLKSLVDDMRAGKVDLLLILSGNPVYDAPAELDFASVLQSNAVELKVFLGSHRNETAELCQWHVPEAHYLESWSDARAYDGTVSIIQPLIEPLYGGKSAHEVIAILAGQSSPAGHDLVQAYWQKQHTGADFDTFWRKSVHDGWIEGTAYSPKQVALKDIAGSSTGGLVTIVSPSRTEPIELNFRRDPSIYDGRFSNNGWLQELPKPLTKLTWDNPIMIGPAMAERLKLNFKDVVELEFAGKKTKGAIWIQAGHPDNSITVFLGYGRTRAGRIGTGTGYDAYPLRTSQAPWFADGAKLTATGETYNLASTQGYQTMETPDGSERPQVQERNLEEYRKEPNFAKEGEPPQDLTLYKPQEFDYAKETYSWGMAIDLNSCVGCNNCIVACQSENNIAVVGHEQTLRGRHMHWLRVDAYYNGPRESPKAFFQPVPCMQCENAPCELVCPVQATVHSSEGLNDMVYNRCVGTRYCSNNCPYKVRRFNFLLFQDWETPQFKLMRNPDVTIRSRGVMEKCTYCVQRISEKRIDAEREDRQINDSKHENELQTACQQSCPANAIVFGNLNDPNSQVVKWKAQARNYSLLGELNTRPRTTYLAEVRNPNPDLETGTKSEALAERM
ncbi:MAG TPA: TAT-variant-translocated molybdopterin oxidoreductase [Terriglobales bacterium]|jgi:MoCo/4Fe-4S cofactor protein with predicted Tat translocation signal|nr:TAT-variant-translocated molybdopterin oxidoreductase [Terriglobales bacterium]